MPHHFTHTLYFTLCSSNMDVEQVVRVNPATMLDDALAAVKAAGCDPITWVNRSDGSLREQAFSAVAIRDGAVARNSIWEP